MTWTAIAISAVILTGIFAVAVAGALLKHRYAQIGLWALMTGLSVGMLETTWELLSVEKGWKPGACGIPDNPGLPSWFPLHEWIPC